MVGRAGEARVQRVDQLGELGLPLTGAHRQRRDGHVVADPDAGVAGEQQVRQRLDEEVVLGQQAGHQPVPAAHLVVAQAFAEQVRERLGSEVEQVRGQVAAQGVAEVQALQGQGDRPAAGLLRGQGLGEQLDQVEHLDVAVAQHLREGVVLLLRPVDPGDAVEEQPVVVARGQPLQLGPRPVQQHRA